MLWRLKGSPVDNDKWGIWLRDHHEIETSNWPTSQVSNCITSKLRRYNESIPGVLKTRGALHCCGSKNIEDQASCLQSYFSQYRYQHQLFHITYLCNRTNRNIITPYHNMYSQVYMYTPRFAQICWSFWQIKPLIEAMVVGIPGNGLLTMNWPLLLNH